MLNGYRSFKMNFRTRAGEIDLIAHDRKTLSFIEVKARHASSFSDPREALTRTKKERIIRAARYYIKRYAAKDVRFDVVTIVEGDLWRRYDLLKNAFTVDDGLR